MPLRRSIRIINSLVRGHALLDGRAPAEPHHQKRSVSRSDLAVLSQDELIEFISIYAPVNADLAITAMRLVKQRLRLKNFAINPDLPPLVRLAAIRIHGDDATNALIARADHDPDLAAEAARCIKDPETLLTASDSVHSSVISIIRSRCAH